MRLSQNIKRNIKHKTNASRFSITNRVALSCQLQSFANVWQSKKYRLGSDPVRKAAMRDWSSIINVCHKFEKRGGRECVKYLQISL